MWLWVWHFYDSCLHNDRKSMLWILKIVSLTLRDTLEWTPKVISNQNSFSRFQYEILCKRMKQTDWPWKYSDCRVFYYSRVGVVLTPSAKKWPNLYQSKFPLPSFLHSPYESLTFLIITLSLKTKNGHKNFQQQNKSIFLGNPYKIFSLWCTFLQEFIIHDHQSLLLAEKF